MKILNFLEFELRKDEASTEKVKASELTAEGKYILMFLEESREPTEHILNEMMEQPEAFRKNLLQYYLLWCRVSQRCEIPQ